MIRLAATLIVLSTVLLAGAVTATGIQGNAEVTADRLKVDSDAKRAEFNGNVKAIYGGLVMTCAKMVIHYDETGNIQRLSARGKVVVIRDDARATAERATLNAAEGVLVLEGKPTLQKGQHRLEGARIRVHLKSGQLDVEEARGRFRFGKEASP